MLNQEQEEEYKDTKIEKGREIHEGEVNDEEIQRIEKEKRKQEVRRVIKRRSSSR